MLIYALLIGIGIFFLMALKDIAKHQRKRRQRWGRNWSDSIWNDEDDEQSYRTNRIVEETGPRNIDDDAKDDR